MHNISNHSSTGGNIAVVRHGGNIAVLRHGGNIAVLRHGGNIAVLRHGGNIAVLRHGGNIAVLRHGGNIAVVRQSSTTFEIHYHKQHLAYEQLCNPTTAEQYAWVNKQLHVNSDSKIKQIVNDQLLFLFHI